MARKYDRANFNVYTAGKNAYVSASLAKTHTKVFTRIEKFFGFDEFPFGKNTRRRYAKRTFFFLYSLVDIYIHTICTKDVFAFLLTRLHNDKTIIIRRPARFNSLVL